VRLLEGQRIWVEGEARALAVGRGKRGLWVGTGVGEVLVVVGGGLRLG